MVQVARSQYSQLFERPSRQLLGEDAVSSLALLGLVIGAGAHVCVKPRVLKSFGTAEHGESRGVPGLHGRDEVDLRADRKVGRFLDRIGPVFGAVAVCRIGRGENAGKKGTLISQGLTDGPWDRDQTVVTAEIVLHIFPSWRVWGHEEDIMGFGRRDRVVIEVINDKGGAVRRKRYVELEEERLYAQRCRDVCGEGEEYVALFSGKVEKDLRSQGGAKAFELGRKDEKVVLCFLAMFEQRRVGFGRREGYIKSPSWMMLAHYAYLNFQGIEGASFFLTLGSLSKRHTFEV